MKAAIYADGGPQKWWSFRSDFPSASVPPPGQVLVKVRAVSLNPLDYKIPKLPGINRQVKGKPMGEDFAGVVVSSHCATFASGDEVFGFANPMSDSTGTFCEFLVADPQRIALKPQSLSFAEAAALPLAAVTSLQCLRDAGGVIEGCRVLLVGASGGTGCSAVQIAKALGAHVTAICSAKNEAFVRELGADEVHDYNSGSPVPTGCPPFDVVYDMVSSTDPQDHQYEADVRPLLAPAGKYVCINGSLLDFVRSVVSNRIGLNLQRRGVNLVEYKQRSLDLQTLGRFAEEGRLRSIVARELPFTEEGIVEAVSAQRSRRLRGKVVLVMDDMSTPAKSRL